MNKSRRKKGRRRRKGINGTDVLHGTFQLLSSIKPQALKYSATFYSPRKSAENTLPEESAGPSGHPG